MDSTPLQTAQKKPFSFLDSTAFPGSIRPTPSRAHHHHLQSLDITPIAFDRTSNPHRIHTLHDVSPPRIETPMQRTGEDNSKRTIDTITLTSSDIDSLADRVRSLLGKTAKFDPFETLTSPSPANQSGGDGDTTKKNSKASSVSSPKSGGHSLANEEDSSLQLLSCSVINSTNFAVPSLATTSHNVASLPGITAALPTTDDNNNYDNSHSHSSSENPISFSSNSVRDHSDPNEGTNQAECEEAFTNRPPLVLPQRLSTIIEASKSSESVTVSPARNPTSILLEADQILERIHKLQLLGKGSLSRTSSTSSSSSSYRHPDLSQNLPSIETVNIPAKHHPPTSPCKSSPIPILVPANVNANEREEIIELDDSDPETEYLEPPAEPNRSMLNQTFNSHIYTRKVNGTTTTITRITPNAVNKRTTSKSRESNTRPAASSSPPPSTEPPPPPPPMSFRPNRTILEEEGNCLSQMQKDTNDLRRLHLELMQFEKEYAKQHERRRAKRKAAIALAASSKNGHVRQSTSATESTSTTATATLSSGQTQIAKSGKDLKSAREAKLKGTTAAASGCHVSETNANTVQASASHKGSSFAPSSSSCPPSSDSTSHPKWSTCREVTTQRSRKEAKQSAQEQLQQQHQQPPPPPHRHSNSNPRQVRFDHQHIAQRVEQFRTAADCQLTGSRPNKQSIQASTARNEQLCACCLRHAKMNRFVDETHQRNLDCLQLDRGLRLDDGHRRAVDRGCLVDLRSGEEEEELNANKSVQTSFVVETVDRRFKSAHTRPSTVAMGEYDQCDYDYDYYPMGELSRTPPRTRANSAPSKKPLAYFVSLDANGPKKKHNSINGTQRPSGRPSCSRVTNGAPSIQPVAAYTLQDAFDRNCYQFKARSEMRARRIKDNEELRRRTAETRQKEIIQIYMKEKKIDGNRVAEKNQQANGDKGGKQHHSVPPPTGNHKASNNKTSTVRSNAGASNQENRFPRPLPLITRRVVADKEMRERTEKVYRKLPEVKAKNVTVKREEDARRRRMMLNIFKQRLKENAIQGRLNWPISQQAITA